MICIDSFGRRKIGRGWGRAIMGASSTVVRFSLPTRLQPSCCVSSASPTNGSGFEFGFALKNTEGLGVHGKLANDTVTAPLPSPSSPHEVGKLPTTTPSLDYKSDTRTIFSDSPADRNTHATLPNLVIVIFFKSVHLIELRTSTHTHRRLNPSMSSLGLLVGSILARLASFTTTH